MQIDIVLFDGFDNLDAIGPFEVFKHASTFGADVEVRLVTLDDQEVVTTGHGLRIEPDGVLETGADAADLVVVPGGGWGMQFEEGAWGEAERGDLPEALERLHNDGAMVASVCTGAMLLATAGLTDGRPAVTHQSTLDDLQESGAEVVEARVVDDGDIVTAGGITSGIDLALYLVEREFGTDIVDQVEMLMEYERRGAVHKG
jgi:transcriptional regulator GlxA family with amidase domain